MRFFGDGAGAVLVETTSKQKFSFDSELYTDSAGRDAFSINGYNDAFDMNASDVFQAASNAVPTCINRLLQRNDMRPSDIDIVVPHQPSLGLLREIADRVRIPFERFHLSMDRYANTVGATIPIALHDAIEAGRLSSGDCVLFAAAGAGITAGAAIHQWC